jgi:hypothetical protein
MNKKEKRRYNELLGFALEIKKLVRNLGRTNTITSQQLEEMFVRYNINLSEEFK